MNDSAQKLFSSFLFCQFIYCSALFEVKLPRPGANLGSLVFVFFFFLSLSLQQRLRPLWYCATHLSCSKYSPSNIFSESFSPPELTAPSTKTLLRTRKRRTSSSAEPRRPSSEPRPWFLRSLECRTPATAVGSRQEATEVEVPLPAGAEVRCQIRLHFSSLF